MGYPKLLGLQDPAGFFLCLLGFSAQVWIARKNKTTLILSAAAALFLFITYMTMDQNLIPPYRRSFPPVVRLWIPGLSMAWSACMLGIAALLALRNRVAPFRAERRGFFRATTAAIWTAPLAATAFGILTRNNFQVKEVDIKIPDLPRDLLNLRLVQLSDIHLSMFLAERDLVRMVDAANELRGDVALVTGDLITSAGDPLEACLNQLARLRAASGIWGCLGNHERYAGVEEQATVGGALRGIQFLRHQAARLPFGKTWLTMVGVDYQPMRKPYLKGVEKLLTLGDFNLLLSHNPDVFPVAAAQGFDLVLAGHTHGGQVNFEILGQDLNVAEFFTPYTKGLYTEATSRIYVNSGLGTIGIPIRLGAPPEITLIKLCAS